jgi:hypothetical protein
VELTSNDESYKGENEKHIINEPFVMHPEGKQHQWSEYSDLLSSPSPTDIDSTFFRRGAKRDVPVNSTQQAEWRFPPFIAFMGL